ncbi:DUF86 domain-containing protein [Candidatus Pacearchaeota archaeon CG10_big_fil_rev_8_21_14_0_10_31_9]|nr:MAG: DUF86 domain-containing protein [Candidatus Pacearchaeota archaeon CG10_big_fil_rev_8_21_14_0_10_31_9]PIZ83827.1 MAG: DUF86 domain-containing protein [Candidatus Pacearchaeota archaeon CG_4_10_14_0_2_um_filter_05_32_18]
MPKEQSVYLEDMLEAIGRIEKYVKGLSYEKFKDNNLVSDAVLRNLEIVGEAAKNISEELKDRYDDVEWKKIVGLRDILIHAYSGVDLEIIWDVIKNKLPGLKDSIVRIVKEENKR